MDMPGKLYRVRIHPDAQWAFGKEVFAQRFAKGTEPGVIRQWKKNKKAEIERARNESSRGKVGLSMRHEAWSIGALAVEWLASRVVGERTGEWYEMLIDKHIVGYLGKFSSAQVTKSAVLDWMQALRKAERSEHTIGRALFVLKSILRWGADQNPPIPIDPAVLAIKKPATTPTIQRRFDPELIDELREKLDEALEKVELRDRSMVLFAIGTGCRRGEIRVADVSWIRWQEGRILIPGEVTKSGKDRSVPLFPELEKALRAWVRDRRSGQLFPSVRAGKSGKGVARGAHMRSVIYRLRELCGHHWNGWHDFRHFYLSLLANRGVDIKTVQEVAGHASPVTTQVYMHASPRYLETARAALTGEGVEKRDQKRDQAPRKRRKKIARKVA
jgi:integrase